MPIILPNPNWQDDKCTKIQREYIDMGLRKGLRMEYKELIHICNEKFGKEDRRIGDIGQLTRGEASRLIGYLLTLGK